MSSQRWLIDGGVAAGLAFALLMVIVIDKLLSQPGGGNTGGPDGPTVLSRPMKLGVTESHRDLKTGLPWDDMGKLLGELGVGYPFKEIPVKDLLDESKLKEYDVLFFTCGPGGAHKDSIEPGLVDNLKRFVAAGGTLYASDWRYECIALAFPEFARPKLAQPGLDGTVQARVVDAGLRDLLGETVPLKFDLDQWKPAAFGGDRVQVLMEGEYELQFANAKAKAPLLVKFQFGKGTVIFTSFHNEKQNSAVEKKLLKYLVFSAVTAKLESEVNQNMLKGGFSPRKSNLLSASSGDESVTKTYKMLNPGKLRFVLAFDKPFDKPGARLKLTVRTPDGQTLEKTGDSTLTIEAESTVAGDWTYTVTALSVPYQDFPFTLNVGEGKEK